MARQIERTSRQHAENVRRFGEREAWRLHRLDMRARRGERMRDRSEQIRREQEQTRIVVGDGDPMPVGDWVKLAIRSGDEDLARAGVALKVGESIESPLGTVRAVRAEGGD